MTIQAHAVYKKYHNLPITRYHFKTVDSTQLHCRKYYKDHLTNVNEWAVVTADQQTSAIGQRYIGTDEHKTWESPIGNITATYMIPWNKSQLHLLKNFSQISSIASYKAVLELSESLGITHLVEPHLKMKWINDLLLNDKKISGTICEYVGDINDNTACILIGTGINIWLPSGLLISQPATSLEYEFRHFLNLPQLTSPQPLSFPESLLSVEILYCLLTRNLFETVNEFRALNGFHCHYHYLSKRMAFIDQLVSIDTGKDTVEGLLCGLTPDGEAQIRLNSGELVVLSSGTLLKKSEAF